MGIAEKDAVIRSYDSWTVKLYRKARQVSIETLDYHAGPLILSRDELAELARMMGLHVRKRKRKKPQNAG